MSKLISLNDRKSKEQLIKEALKTDNFIVFYTDEQQSEHRVGVLQGSMNLEDISLYSNILNYMATQSVYTMFDDTE